MSAGEESSYQETPVIRDGEDANHSPAVFAPLSQTWRRKPFAVRGYHLVLTRIGSWLL